jgi:hypothetical protein
MRTNGLVVALAIALVACGRAHAVESANQPSVPIDPATGNLVFDLSADENQPASWCQNCDTRLFPDGMWKCLVGCHDGYDIYAGTEFSALSVASRTGGVINLSLSDTTAPGVSTVSFREPGGVNDWGYSPRIWLGAQLTDVWGVRARYWRLSDTDFHPPDVTPGFTPTGTNFATFEDTDRMEAWTVDVEAVRTAKWGPWEAEGFVGGRHADFTNDTNLLAFGVFTTGNFINITLQNGCAFDGSGVTYGGTLRRQLGSSHLHIFTTARGSFLDGHSDSFARADGAVASSPSAPLVGAATVRRDHAPADLEIFELQAGVEFDWDLKQAPLTFFLRCAYEYQNWNIIGLPTGGAGFGGTIGELTTNSFSSAKLGGMTLNGVSIATGVLW